MLPGLKVLGSRVLRVSAFQFYRVMKFKGSGLQCNRVSEFKGFQFAGFPFHNVTGVQHFRN